MKGRIKPQKTASMIAINCLNIHVINVLERADKRADTIRRIHWQDLIC